MAGDILTATLLSEIYTTNHNKLLVIRLAFGRCIGGIRLPHSLWYNVTSHGSPCMKLHPVLCHTVSSPGNDRNSLCQPANQPNCQCAWYIVDIVAHRWHRCPLATGKPGNRETAKPAGLIPELLTVQRCSLPKPRYHISRNAESAALPEKTVLASLRSIKFSKCSYRISIASLSGNLFVLPISYEAPYEFLNMNSQYELSIEILNGNSRSHHSWTTYRRSPVTSELSNLVNFASLLHK